MPALLEYQVIELLQSYEIPCPPHAVASSPQEAAAAAHKLSFPVVMKILSPDILHKSDVGGVRLNLKDTGSVFAAYSQMIQTVSTKCPQALLKGVILYPQVADGLEVIVGVTQDVTFGPVLMFGLGGVFVEVMRDVAFRAIPIRPTDAYQMIHSIKNYKVLQGWRGQKPVDMDRLAGLLCNVSRLVNEHPEIAEMDLNPVRIDGENMWVLDAKLVTR